MLPLIMSVNFAGIVFLISYLDLLVDSVQVSLRNCHCVAYRLTSALMIN